jgi:hypothetical protein
VKDDDSDEAPERTSESPVAEVEVVRSSVVQRDVASPSAAQHHVRDKNHHGVSIADSSHEVVVQARSPATDNPDDTDADDEYGFDDSDAEVSRRSSSSLERFENSEAHVNDEDPLNEGFLESGSTTTTDDGAVARRAQTSSDDHRRRRASSASESTGHSGHLRRRGSSSEGSSTGSSSSASKSSEDSFASEDSYTCVTYRRRRRNGAGREKPKVATPSSETALKVEPSSFTRRPAPSVPLWIPSEDENDRQVRLLRRLFFVTR